MEETQKLIEEIDNISDLIPVTVTEYEAYDFAIKILALQEQRKANDILADIASEIRILRNKL
jgi:hypothetical protein